jgi:acyl-CoA thioester hydrolase
MRFDLPEAKKLTLEMVIPIRWGDMDAMGHVNNTIYFRYLEIVRIEWLHQVVGAPGSGGEGPVIVNTFCNFPQAAQVPRRRPREALRRQALGGAASRRT